MPINHVIQQDIYSNLTIPSFDKIYHNDTFQKFEKLNKQEIYEESFNTFLKYYESKSENELKSCCPSDFKNYQTIKDIDPKNIYQLDLVKDLITYPDYKSITIDLKDINTNKNYVVKFIKEENKLQDNLNQINNALNNSNQSSSWEGIYWLYPYNLDSKKIGNYYINIFNQNKEFGFSGDGEFNYKISTKIIDNNKLYIFDLNSQSSNPLAIIYKNQNKYYLKSSVIKIERSDLKETQNGYPINWAKSSDDVPDSPQ
ncbi:hypothetical protein A0O34_20420 [Chryseobacterium glaciei]|uniref:Uncharacterized protein n=1 Tax=Chryseobacterium glaciei TaxID=1685010 RepID=A0A172Y0R2_9FLAO|nr:hypothetical protein [Chryseobacterium glaciei]ANF52730.1 hypothetical protein A0O34_20420 [Chryseobacterium glaciei]